MTSSTSILQRIEATLPLRERAWQNPMGAGSAVLGKVFGALGH